jgi:16S rRNA G966 N2-methylase RsmD
LKKSCTKKNKRTRKKRGGALSAKKKAELVERLRMAATAINTRKTNLTTQGKKSKNIEIPRVLDPRVPLTRGGKRRKKKTRKKRGGDNLSSIKELLDLIESNNGFVKIIIQNRDDRVSTEERWAQVNAPGPDRGRSVHNEYMDQIDWGEEGMGYENIIPNKMYDATIKKTYDEEAGDMEGLDDAEREDVKDWVDITIYDDDGKKLEEIEEIQPHQFKHGPDMKRGRNWDGEFYSEFIERWFVLFKRNDDGTAGEQIKFVDSTEGGKRRKKKTRKKRGGDREIIIGDIWKQQDKATSNFREYGIIAGIEVMASGAKRIKFRISNKPEIPAGEGNESFMTMSEIEFREEYDKFPGDWWETTPPYSGDEQWGGGRKKKTRKYKGNKYPYKNITKKEAIADFIKLKTTTNPRSLNGLEIVNYGTEKLRVRTKYRGKSLIQRWKDKKARKTLKKFANRLYKGSYTDDLFHAYRSAIALSWGTLSSMRTSAALQMYKKYNAKKVLDFTAGWGSRMTAALAADIDYIGIDSNKSLKKGYNKIIKTVKKHTKSKVKLFFQPAETVNYSKLDYDFVFTSPPYEYLELYEHMKNYEGTKKIKQAHSANDKRRKNDGFYDTFLIPTIKEIYKHLPKGKWMCLNVPDLMYDKIKKKWKACNKKEDYMISKRVGSNMKSDDRRGQEFVYCWKKK